MDEKKLFLLDAYALIYRAYYALIRSPRFNTKKLNTSAIFGFCNTLDEILRKETPSHIAVCFDPKGGHTFRHELYSDYKANRDAQPEDITLSVPWIKRILEAYNIPVIEMADYEADDVIGTLAHKAEEEGYTTYMMTPDKDYGQLVTEKILMYRPPLGGKGFEVRGPREVTERYGIERTSQMIDLLALEGDSIDNIPGCPGVGEKTAQKLIAQYGSVENLLAHTDELKGALQRKVKDNAEQILLSKELATIRTDVPIDVDIATLERKPENVDALLEIYRELEFRTLAKKLTDAAGDEAPAAASKPSNEAPSLFDFAETVEEQPMAGINAEGYAEVTDAGEIGRLIAEAARAESVGMAIYAVGADSMMATAHGIALSLEEGKASYLRVPGEEPGLREFVQMIAPLFTSGATIVSHDVKRDYIILKNLGIEWTAPYFDTSVAHYLLQPEMRHSLSIVASTLLEYRTIDYDETGRERKGGQALSDAEAFARTSEQADIVNRLRRPLEESLAEQSQLKLLREIELPLVAVLAEMEWTGVRVDVKELHKLSRQLSERLAGLEREVYEMAGGEFNIASPMQVGEILFDRLKIDPKAKRTKKGAYSTTEEILEKYSHQWPIVDLILKIRRLRKLLATYINALPTLINPRTGKIHTSYNQTVTATGRISSTNPNLQNIPVRTDDGREIRRAFIADPGDIFLSADYSQIELRLMADMSGDQGMVDAFLSGADFHQATAAKIYHEALSEVTDDQRRNAKTANFGIIYGISAFGLSERLGISRGESKELIQNYFLTYPGVKAYMDRCIEQAREDGYVTTIFGRRRYLPEINSRNAVVRGYAERNAINAPLQGSAADIIKRAMVEIQRRIESLGLKSRMIMQVHDELIFNVKPDELETLSQIVVDDMTNAYHGKVPLEVAWGCGENWLQAH